MQLYRPTASQMEQFMDERSQLRSGAARGSDLSTERARLNAHRLAATKVVAVTVKLLLHWRVYRSVKVIASVLCSVAPSLWPFSLSWAGIPPRTKYPGRTSELVYLIPQLRSQCCAAGGQYSGIARSRTLGDPAKRSVRSVVWLSHSLPRSLLLSHQYCRAKTVFFVAEGLASSRVETILLEAL